MKNSIDFTLLYSHLAIAFKSLELFSSRGQRPLPLPGALTWTGWGLDPAVGLRSSRTPSDYVPVYDS